MKTPTTIIREGKHPWLKFQRVRTITRPVQVPVEAVDDEGTRYYTGKVTNHPKELCKVELLLGWGATEREAIRMAGV
jgi:hypothetical protein